MKLKINILGALILISGCSQTKLINHKLSVQCIEKINSQVSKQTVQIVLLEGKTHKANDLLLTPDSIKYFNLKTKQNHQISSLEVKDIITSKGVSLKPWIDVSIKPRTYLREKTKKLVGIVTLIDGNILEGSNIQVRLDSTILYDSTKTKKTVLATSQINHIIIKDRVRGGLNGLLIGPLISETAIFICGIMEASKGERSEDIGLLEIGPNLAPVTIPIGAFFGYCIGYAVGIKIKFIFPDNEHLKK